MAGLSFSGMQACRDIGDVNRHPEYVTCIRHCNYRYMYIYNNYLQLKTDTHTHARMYTHTRTHARTHVHTRYLRNGTFLNPQALILNIDQSHERTNNPRHPCNPKVVPSSKLDGLYFWHAFKNIKHHYRLYCQVQALQHA